MTFPIPITNVADPRWARAISHPLRIRLLAVLEEREASPVVLADALGQPLATIAYHVRVLAELGLLELVRTRQRRGATEHYYRTKLHPRVTDAVWAQLDPVAKQRVLTGVLSQAFESATRAAAFGGFDAADAHFTRTPLQLDAKGWRKLAKATKRWLDEASKIQTEAADRVEASSESAVDVGLVVLLFENRPISTSSSRDIPEPSHGSASRHMANSRRRASADADPT